MGAPLLSLPHFPDFQVGDDQRSFSSTEKQLAPIKLRTGIDIAEVEEVAASIATFGDRYLHRLFTAHELTMCGSSGLVAASRLAARFAAKEAMIKVLRPPGPRPEWRAMEVRSAPDGSCRLRLSGMAEQLATEAGISRLALSLTHEGPWAGAVVVALCWDGNGGL